MYRWWWWNTRNKQATFRFMTTELHSVGAAWFASQLTTMQNFVNDTKPCGSPRLRMSQDAYCSPIGYPDESVSVRNLGSAPDERESTCPKIIMECAVSQSRQDVMSKAWRYLWETNMDVHAVFVFLVNYPFFQRATLEVYRRDGSPNDVG